MGLDKLWESIRSFLVRRPTPRPTGGVFVSSGSLFPGSSPFVSQVVVVKDPSFSAEPVRWSSVFEGTSSYGEVPRLKTTLTSFIFYFYDSSKDLIW